MIIIFEGVDRAGKSTIINEFIKMNPNAVIFKLSDYYRPKNNSPEEIQNLEVIYDELFNQARSLSYDQGKIVIFDRAYPSEIVYSYPMRGYDAFENQFWQRLDKELAKFGSVLYVYVHPPKSEDHLKRLADEGSSMKKETVVELLKRYESFWHLTSLPKLAVLGWIEPKLNALAIQNELNQKH